MTAIDLALLQGGTGIVDQLQAAFPTQESQWVATGLVVGGYLLLAAVAYALGSRLSRRLGATNVEAIQSVVITAIGVVAAALLVVIWRSVTDVLDALGAIEANPETGVKLLIVALAFGTSYSVTRITKGLIRIGEGRDAITNHQREVLHHVVQIIIFIPAALFSLALFGVRASDLLLSAGALGVVLGLAARQTLGSVIAGFVLLFSRPFEVGDWIQVDESEGIVTDISIINTRLRTFDDEHVMLPNDQITDSAVTNLSRNDRLRVQVEVGVDYHTDIEHAARVAVEAMESCEQVIEERPPDVVLEEFGDSAVVLNLRFWIDDPTIRQKWAAQNAVIDAVKRAFEREGIKIPYPQRELAGREEAGGFRVTGDATAGGSDGDGVASAHDAESAVEPAGDAADGSDPTDGEDAGTAAEGRAGESADGTGETADDGGQEVGPDAAPGDEDVLDDVTATATDVHPNALEPAIVRVDDDEEKPAVDALGDEDD